MVSESRPEGKIPLGGDGFARYSNRVSAFFRPAPEEAPGREAGVN